MKTVKKSSHGFSFVKSAWLLLLGLCIGIFTTNAFEISTTLSNAVQVIQRTIFTSNGTQSGTTLLDVNAGQGKILFGTSFLSDFSGQRDVLSLMADGKLFTVPQVKDNHVLKVDYSLSKNITWEVYKNYAGALTYALSQSPSSGNIWMIQLPAGTIDEDIEIHAYVPVKWQGQWSTVINGKIFSTHVGTLDVNDINAMSLARIDDVTLKNLWVVTTWSDFTMLWIQNVDVLWWYGTWWFLWSVNAMFSSGVDFSSAWYFMAMNATIYGGKYNAIGWTMIFNSIIQNSDFTSVDDDLHQNNFSFYGDKFFNDVVLFSWAGDTYYAFKDCFINNRPSGVQDIIYSGMYVDFSKSSYYWDWLGSWLIISWWEFHIDSSFLSHYTYVTGSIFSLGDFIDPTNFKTLSNYNYNVNWVLYDIDNKFLTIDANLDNMNVDISDLKAGFFPGSIKIADGGESCDPTNIGIIKYDSVTDTFKWCGLGWNWIVLGQWVQ